MLSKSGQTLIDILRFELCHIPLPSDFEIADVKKLIMLSTQHDLQHLVYHAAEKNHLPEIDQIDEFNYDTAVFRYLRQSTELSDLETLFEQEHISFVPLKGVVMRQWYPEAWMRTCTDIDILIHGADLEHAAGLLQDHLQYKRKKTSGPHDVSLYSFDQTVHLELHYSLLEEGRMNDVVIRILNSVWNYVTPDSDGSSKGKMSDEMLYFYHISHMAKHFIKGGNCGIRYLMDLWLLNQHMKGGKEKLDKMLNEAGLLTFAQKMSEIAEGWFSPVQYTVDEQLEHYIIGSALHGSFFSKASYNYLVN